MGQRTSKRRFRGVAGGLENLLRHLGHQLHVRDVARACLLKLFACPHIHLCPAINATPQRVSVLSLRPLKRWHDFLHYHVSNIVVAFAEITHRHAGTKSRSPNAHRPPQHHSSVTHSPQMAHRPPQAACRSLASWTKKGMLTR